MKIDQVERLNEKVMAALNSEPDFEVVTAVMSAHVQRVICDRAQNDPLRSRELADAFHAACLMKITSVNGMPRVPLCSSHK